MGIGTSLLSAISLGTAGTMTGEPMSGELPRWVTQGDIVPLTYQLPLGFERLSATSPLQPDSAPVIHPPMVEAVLQKGLANSVPPPGPSVFYTGNTDTILNASSFATPIPVR